MIERSMVGHPELDTLMPGLLFFNEMRALRHMQRCGLKVADDGLSYRLQNTVHGFTLTLLLSKLTNGIAARAACYLNWDGDEEGPEDRKSSMLCASFHDGHYIVEGSIRDLAVFSAILERFSIDPKSRTILQDMEPVVPPNEQPPGSMCKTAREQIMDIIEAMCEKFLEGMV